MFLGSRSCSRIDIASCSHRLAILPGSSKKRQFTPHASCLHWVLEVIQCSSSPILSGGQSGAEAPLRASSPLCAYRENAHPACRSSGPWTRCLWNTKAFHSMPSVGILEYQVDSSYAYWSTLANDSCLWSLFHKQIEYGNNNAVGEYIYMPILSFLPTEWKYSRIHVLASYFTSFLHNTFSNLNPTSLHFLDQPFHPVMIWICLRC